MAGSEQFSQNPPAPTPPPILPPPMFWAAVYPSLFLIVSAEKAPAKSAIRTTVFLVLNIFKLLLSFNLYVQLLALYLYKRIVPNFSNAGDHANYRNSIMHSQHWLSRISQDCPLHIVCFEKIFVMYWVLHIPLCIYSFGVVMYVMIWWSNVGWENWGEKAVLAFKPTIQGYSFFYNT